MVEFGGHNRITKPSGSESEAWIDTHCWSCDRDISAAVVARPYGDRWSKSETRWLWCPSCGAPSVRTEEGDVRPGTRFGANVPGLPPEVAAAYDEARDCMSVSAYTAAELICRKIILHVAVDKNMEPKTPKGRAPTFAACIDHLEAEGYVTPPMRPWVERIKDHGNESTHELDPPSPERAESTVTFTAQMLNNTYGMEHLVQKHAADGESPPGDA